MLTSQLEEKRALFSAKLAEVEQACAERVRAAEERHAEATALYQSSTTELLACTKDLAKSKTMAAKVCEGWFVHASLLFVFIFFLISFFSVLLSSQLKREQQGLAPKLAEEQQLTRTLKENIPGWQDKLAAAEAKAAATRAADARAIARLEAQLAELAGRLE